MDYTSLIKEIDIPELVKALILCARGNCHDCGRYDPECENNLHNDAAAAIVTLERQVENLERELRRTGEWQSTQN